MFDYVELDILFFSVFINSREVYFSEFKIIILNRGDDVKLIVEVKGVVVIVYVIIVVVVVGVVIYVIN